MFQSDSETVLAPNTIAPLPSDLRAGLVVTTVFGFVSFFSSICLFGILTYRMLRWRRKHQRFPNQFLFLIFNLALADIQQSLAFLLNSSWLTKNGIFVGHSACFAQGWFVSTGDLASGVWCLAIGVHTFADLIHDFRLSTGKFVAAVAGLWTFIYACAIIGIVMHPTDYYVRAGAWCWISAKYDSERLYLHYLWIFIAEFGVVFLYAGQSFSGVLYVSKPSMLHCPDATMFVLLHYRIRTHVISTAESSHARRAAKYMVIYPIVYVFCTLPLASMRMASLRHDPLTFTALTAAGGIITSNGWLDVLLYTLTRRVLILSDSDASSALDEKRGLDTFAYRPDREWGTTTTITALKVPKIKGHHGSRHSKGSKTGQRAITRLGSRQGSEEELWHDEMGARGGPGVKKETVVQVRSEPMELTELNGIGYIKELERSSSFDTDKDEKLDGIVSRQLRANF
ncbi:MAG: hypothetical protein M1822_008112 [Bathelium mastoideum]|nr:MAG: hypothetical protein M1822_008112 [Bathelium mastoideum]